VRLQKFSLQNSQNCSNKKGKKERMEVIKNMEWVNTLKEKHSNGNTDERVTESIPSSKVETVDNSMDGVRRNPLHTSDKSEIERMEEVLWGM
jgi:hypothetical protein